MRSAVSYPSTKYYETTTDNPHRGRVDATALLTFYLFLLMAIPASLVLAPVGAAGGPSTLFALLILVIYLGMWLSGGKHVYRGRQPIRLAVVLFTCATVASYASINRHVLPVLEKNGADRGLMFVFGWLGISLLAADGIDSPNRLRTLLRRQVFGATVMAVLGAIESVTGTNIANYIKIPGLIDSAPVTDLVVRSSFVRPSATASHPIEFGAVLVMSLPFAIHQARFAPRDKRVHRWLQVGLIVLVTPLTVSRSAVLALAICAIVLLPTWSKSERRKAYTAVLAGLGVSLLVLPELIVTIGNLFLHIGSDSSTQYRTDAISWSWSYIVRNPWLGRGFGTFQPNLYFFTDDQYLSSLISTGVVGVFALLMLFVVGWVQARSARRLTTNEESRDLGQSLATSVAVAAVSFSNYDALSFPVASGLTFLLLGCVGAYWRLMQDRPLMVGISA